MDIQGIIESVLFASDKPLDIGQMQNCFPENSMPEKSAIRAAIAEISAIYADRPIELVEVASGFHFQVRQQYSDWVTRLFEERAPRYSRALMETLAIIAYRQPTTRGGIEEIRGVNVSSNIVRTLLDRGWIRVVGHKDVPGKPALFATTRTFLDYFNLKSLSDLPQLNEILPEDAGMPTELPEIPESFECTESSGLAALSGIQEIAEHPREPILSVNPDEIPS